MSLRSKLIIAFCGPLLILITVGLMSVRTVDESSAALQKILRENHDSVAASYRMKSAIERLDRFVEVTTPGGAVPSAEEARSAVADFERELAFQRGNVTVRGEQQVTDELAESWEAYRRGFEEAFRRDPPDPQAADQRRLSERLRAAAQKIIELNLGNMISVDGQARLRALEARRTIILLVLSGVVLAIVFISITGPFILRPLASLTASVREIRKGNLELVVNVRSRDEIGQLAEAVNEMAGGLREFRRSDRARLLRMQQSTQLAMDSLSDAVIVCGPDGKIELANDVAQRLFGLKPESNISSGDERVYEIFRQACRDLRPVRPKGYSSAIQLFPDGEERFFLPEAIPMTDERLRLIGVTVVLFNVTDIRRLDEVKSGMISTVSHELKTPLTSIRLAVHVLLSEKVGPLTPKQIELLDAARKDSDRLHHIIESLLDMSRMESGRTSVALEPAASEQLVFEVIEGMRSAFADKGVSLSSDTPGDLPPVLVDHRRIRHVFTNLLTNALRHTPAGGGVDVSARAEGDRVRFTVSDTGSGIPEEHLPHIFDKFYRVSGLEDQGDSGLGLAIAREIVEAHGGSVDAKSRVGEGTKIGFTLKAFRTARAGEKPQENKEAT